MNENEAGGRRQFIKQLAVIGGAGILAIGLDGCHSDKSGESSTGWVDAGPQAAIKAGTPTKVTAGKAPAFVTRNATGELVALSSICTHRGCPVNWNGATNQFVCPCHGAKYDSSGNNVSGPAKSPLQTLAVKVDATGHVMVQPVTA